MKKVNYQVPEAELLHVAIERNILSVEGQGGNGTGEVENASDGGYYGDEF